MMADDIESSSLPTLLEQNSPVEFVSIGDTIADIVLREKASAGLATISTILLSVLVVFTFAINLMLLATILSSYKLRHCLLYVMFCTAAALNVIDVVLIMFISLLYVANGSWFMSETTCRLNAWAQQFVFMMSLLGITLMAIERALGLIGQHLVRPKNFAILSFVFFIASNCFSIPLFMPNFPVRVYRFRYLCAIGRFSRSTISYTIVQILVYGGCLFVLLLCFGSLLRYRVHDRNLPAKPQDYGAFIMEYRALHDHLMLGRLVLSMALAYLFIQGPYISLTFFVQVRNSAELISRYGEMEMPQDIDILLTLLRFFFPFILPLLILSTCNDIWTKFLNLLFCRRGVAQTFSTWQRFPGRITDDENNVLTLVATSNGLQLRVPTNFPFDRNFNNNQRQEELPPTTIINSDAIDRRNSTQEKLDATEVNTNEKKDSLSGKEDPRMFKNEIILQNEKDEFITSDDSGISLSERETLNLNHQIDLTKEQTNSQQNGSNGANSSIIEKNLENPKDVIVNPDISKNKLTISRSSIKPEIHELTMNRRRRRKY